MQTLLETIKQSIKKLKCFYVRIQERNIGVDIEQVLQKM